MLVYRVQHSRTNDGPYQGRNANKVNNTYRGKKHHPHIREDEAVSDNCSHACDGKLFGFRTLRSLREWFSDDLFKLHAAGFHIVIYEVPTSKVEIYRRQITFNPRTKTRLRTRSLVSKRVADALSSQNPQHSRPC